jgi:hypothetical protein
MEPAEVVLLERLNTDIGMLITAVLIIWMWLSVIAWPVDASCLEADIDYWVLSHAGDL